MHLHTKTPNYKGKNYKGKKYKHRALTSSTGNNRKG